MQFCYIINICWKVVILPDTIKFEDLVPRLEKREEFETIKKAYLYDYNENKHCSFMEYGISYSSDLDKAIKLAKEELKKLYKDANYDINVKVIRWDSSAVILRCYVWGKDISESFENSCKLNENLKKVFDKNNIEIPYNYINVINKK